MNWRPNLQVPVTSKDGAAGKKSPKWRTTMTRTKRADDRAPQWVCAVRTALFERGWVRWIARGVGSLVAAYWLLMGIAYGIGEPLPLEP